jgi:hypothetical protein
VDLRRTPEGIGVDSSRINMRISRGTAGRPVRRRLPRPEQTESVTRHAITAPGFTMCSAERPRLHERESHTHSIPSNGREEQARAARAVHDGELVSEPNDLEVQRGA